MDEENSKHNMRWMGAVKTLLSAVRYKIYRPYSIPVVSDELRKWNENAYKPKVVSIGPQYRGRRDLLPMEEIKWRCMESLLCRAGIHTDSSLEFEKCMEAILKLDAAVRASYVDEIKLDRYELATIMFIDGCFLLELLISGSVELDSQFRRSGERNPGENVRKMELVLSDLTLLENQIPLFIPGTLFMELFKVPCSPMVIKNLVPPIFGFYPNFRVNHNLDDSHFLGMVSSYMHQEREILEIEDNRESQHQSIFIHGIGGEGATQGPRVEHLNRCATRLQAAGITIKRRNYENNIPTVGIISSFKFNIKFNTSNGILEIPPLNITQITEAQWLNFIAWEHHNKKFQSSSFAADRCCIFTSFALLFSDLVCCASDVQLLKEREVIVDHLSMSNHDLVTFFHSITKGVDRGIIDPIYSGNFHALNTYLATNYTMKIIILLYHYFGRLFGWTYGLNKFFRRGYNFAATIVTVLTVVQTCYAIVAYHHSNNAGTNSSQQ